MNIGISEKNRGAVAGILNALLADEYVLYTKTRNFHWNVTGLQFHDLHKFFEAQYEALDDIIDQVAERVRSLGGAPFATLVEFNKHTRIKESPGKKLSADQMLAELLKDHELVIREIREDLDAYLAKYGDAGTQDFVTGLMEQHEKMAWMLRSFLSNK